MLPDADHHALPEPDVPLEGGARPRSGSRHPTVTDGPMIANGADLDVAPRAARAGIDQGGRVDAGAHRSTTRAMNSASATRLPSTYAVPFMRQVRPRCWSISSFEAELVAGDDRAAELHVVDAT